MKNEYKINKEVIMSWAKVFRLPTAAHWIVFVIWCVVLIMGLCLIGLFSFVGADFLAWYCITICGVLLPIYKLFISHYVFYSSRYRMLSKTYGVTEWQRTIEFADDDIILTDHTSITRLKYQNITKIKEKENNVIILFNNQISVRLYKDTFVEGSWEECKEKINSMMQ